jgi:hypothetical protein
MLNCLFINISIFTEPLDIWSADTDPSGGGWVICSLGSSEGSCDNLNARARIYSSFEFAGLAIDRVPFLRSDD